MLELEHLPRGRGLTGTINFLQRFTTLAEICGKPVKEGRQILSKEIIPRNVMLQSRDVDFDQTQSDRVVMIEFIDYDKNEIEDTLKKRWPLGPRCCHSREERAH